MLPKVFEIDEILRPIAIYVFDLDVPSAIALARCCRALEEPVLSLCWEDQSLDRLAGVLPKSVLNRSGDDRSPFYVRASAMFLGFHKSIVDQSHVLDLHPSPHSRRTIQATAIRILDQTHRRGHHPPLRGIPRSPSIQLPYRDAIHKPAIVELVYLPLTPAIPPPFRFSPDFHVLRERVQGYVL